MTVQIHTIDDHRHLASCQHSAWTPCTDATRDRVL